MLQSSFLDVEYSGIKKFTSMFLLQARNGEAAIVDTGTPHSFPLIQKFLKLKGVGKDQLTKILLTHSHLDHSGNISLFTQHYPNIKIYLHPLTAKVMRNPTFLIQRMKDSMKSKYYNEFLDQVRPISDKFLFTTCNNMSIKLGGEDIIKVVNTPGHSKDHISFFDLSSKTLYSGDGIGQCYKDISPNVSIFSFPPLSDPFSAPLTIHKVRELNPVRFGLGHFGYVENAKKHIDQCEEFITKYMKILKSPANAQKALESIYDKSFYPGCTKTIRKLRGHMKVNYLGILYALHPEDFLDAFDF
ncbi:hypothetical protein M9Y10_021536 [Tritrichomonas musculus]|uniref:Metallo-beta-lactamase domain-containing protein n=1 Tax=Tritrichomonas musculus TaxID=1915356 RepID=A0ABR2KQU4_9EUKA